MTKKQGRPPAFTIDQAEKIRELWGEGEMSQKEIAALFNVSPMTIYNVIKERGPYGPPVVVPVADFKEHTFVAGMEIK